MDDGTAIKQKLHGVPGNDVERVLLCSFYCRFLLNWFSLHELHVPYNTSFTTLERSMANFGRKEGVMDKKDNRHAVFTIYVYINMWRTISLDVSHRRPHSVYLWAYCTHPTHNVNDVWRFAKPPGSTSSTLFEQWRGFFYVPQEPDKWKCCETGSTVFRPYPRRLESLTVRRCHYKGSTFFSVILSCWVLVWPGLEPVTSNSADRRSPNWANRAKSISTLHRIAFLVEMKSDRVSYVSLFTLRCRVTQKPIQYICDVTLSRSGRRSILRSRLWTGASFPKAPILNGPAKLLLFTCKIEASIAWHLT